MSKKLKVGDIFNESDEDDMIQVTEIRDKQDPPVVLCSTMHDNSDSEETEQEYDVGYVSGAVDLRQKYESYGFAALDVQGIYRLSKKDLIHALSLAKQSTFGLDKMQLRDRMILHNGFSQVPSDTESESDSSDSGSDSESDSESSASDWEEQQPSPKETKKKKNTKEKIQTEPPHLPRPLLQSRPPKTIRVPAKS